MSDESHDLCNRKKETITHLFNKCSTLKRARTTAARFLIFLLMIVLNVSFKEGDMESYAGQQIPL